MHIIENIAAGDIIDGRVVVEVEPTATDHTIVWFADGTHIIVRVR